MSLNDHRSHDGKGKIMCAILFLLPVICLGQSLHFGQSPTNFVTHREWGAQLIIPFLSTEDGTYADYSGNGNDGTQAVATNRPAILSGAAVFDGADDYISIPAAVSNEWSVLLWMRNTANNARNEHILTDRTAANDVSFSIANKFYSDLTFTFANRYEGSAVYFDTPANPASGVWAHLGVVQAATSISFYYNGVVADESVIDNPLGILGDRLIAGRNGDYAGYPAPWDGTLDDVLVFNRALSGEEIAELYNKGRTDRNYAMVDYDFSTDLEAVFSETTNTYIYGVPGSAREALTKTYTESTNRLSGAVWNPDGILTNSSYKTLPTSCVIGTTLIAPDIGISAAHCAPTTGTEVVFMDYDGSSITRTVTAYDNLGSDIRLVMLNDYVDINPVKLFPTNWANYFPTGFDRIPFVALFGGGQTILDGTATAGIMKAPIYADRLERYFNFSSTGSGSAIVADFAGEQALSHVVHTSGGNAGYFTGNMVTQIQASITGMGSTGVVEVIDLSGYTDWSAP